MPSLRSHAQSEPFIAHADLSHYDLADLRPLHFEYAAKDARVNMRVPASLLAAVKACARAKGMPYQRFIREALERQIGHSS